MKSRLRDERIEAYRKLLTATSTAHFYDPEAIRAIAKAYNEIALLAETPELAKAAQAAWFAYGDTQRAHKNVKEDPEVSTATDYARAIAISEDARRRFLDLARKELGVEGRSEEFLNLEALPPEDTLKGPEPPASQP